MGIKTKIFWDNFDFDRYDAYLRIKGGKDRIELRVEKDFKRLFNAKCIKNNTSMSEELLKGAIKFMKD